MKIAVLGAGSWGTALTIHLARIGHEVLLWARDPEVVAAIESEKRHPRRLVDVPIPALVRATADLSKAFDHSDTIVLAIPCESLRSVLDAGPAPGEKRRFVSTAKGIEPDTLMRMSEVIREHHKHSAVAFLLRADVRRDGVVRRDPTVASADSGAASPGGQQTWAPSCGCTAGMILRASSSAAP
jgi:glycerol-3-phosphate dehydrogenase (NAD(P)+)